MKFVLYFKLSKRIGALQAQAERDQGLRPSQAPAQDLSDIVTRLSKLEDMRIETATNTERVAGLKRRIEMLEARKERSAVILS